MRSVFKRIWKRGKEKPAPGRDRSPTAPHLGSSSHSPASRVRETSEGIGGAVMGGGERDIEEKCQYGVISSKEPRISCPPKSGDDFPRAFEEGDPMMSAVVNKLH